MDDIDKETLRKYRQIFEIRNDGHVWHALTDKSFLEKLGGYRKDRKTGVEGLTLAGLLMFGTGQAIRERFDNVFMDYRNDANTFNQNTKMAMVCPITSNDKYFPTHYK